MTDLLDTPVGEFEWGPEERRHTMRDRLSTDRPWLSPWLAITVGAALMIAGFVLSALSVNASASSRPNRDTPPIASTTTGAADSAMNGAANEAAIEEPTPRAAGVVVHVTGQVVAPGLAELPDDGRVLHAIEAAGGALPDADLDSLNLAARVEDGVQVNVPRQESRALDDAPDPDTIDRASPTPVVIALEESADAPSGANPPAVSIDTPAPSTSSAERAAELDELISRPPITTEPIPDDELWGPDEPLAVPPEIEALMADRETSPDPAVIEDLLLDAGLEPPPPEPSSQP